MNKTRLNLLIVVLVASSLVLIGICHFGVAQSGINTSTTISTDTTWTQANSPYNIAGNVLINSGVTLTLAAGTTLNLNGYMVVTGSLIIQPGVTINIQSASGYIQVNGVLSAVGTNTNPIQINGTEGAPQYMFGHPYYSSITFGQNNGGNQSSAGSIIEYAVFTSTTVTVSSDAQLSDDTFQNVLIINGWSPTVTNDVLEGGIYFSGGSATISGNTISSGIVVENQENQYLDQPSYITDNQIIGGASTGTGAVTFLEAAFPNTVFLERNVISTDGINDGVDIALSVNNQCAVQIENNTIINNAVGIDIHYGLPQLISGNNIYNNTVNLKLENTASINCSNNWWGTSDQQAIAQTIYDFKDDFTLGTATFVPFLTVPNPEATPNQNLPISTPTSSPSPTNTLTQPPFAQTAHPTQQPSQTTTSPTPALPQSKKATPAFALSGTTLLVVISVLLAIILGLTAAVVIFWRRSRTPNATPQI
jgi:hypothetical protein